MDAAASRWEKGAWGRRSGSSSGDLLVVPVLSHEACPGTRLCSALLDLALSLERNTATHPNLTCGAALVVLSLFTFADIAIMFSERTSQTAEK